jgi:hypothetical protein
VRPEKDVGADPAHAEEGEAAAELEAWNQYLGTAMAYERKAAT